QGGVRVRGPRGVPGARRDAHVPDAAGAEHAAAVRPPGPAGAAGLGPRGLPVPDARHPAAPAPGPGRGEPPALVPALRRGAHLHHPGLHDRRARHPQQAPAPRGDQEDGERDPVGERHLPRHVRPDAQAPWHHRVGV
ncbi:unnamed protein product, partial [Ixodes pacificus]